MRDPTVVFNVVSVSVIAAVAAMWVWHRDVSDDLKIRLAAACAGSRANIPNMSNSPPRFGVKASSSVPLSLAHPEPNASNRVRRVPAMTLGEWRSWPEWKDEGQATARSTVATLLWAAGGGELATMARLLELDAPARAQAKALYDLLPWPSRSLYATPEELIASVAIEAIPPTAAQLSWLHERDADHATVGVMLAQSDQKVSAQTLASSAQEGRPLMLVDNHQTKLAILTLHRSEGGWRVVVPVEAIDRVAADLQKEDRKG